MRGCGGGFSVVTFEPIGFFRCAAAYKCETPRQGVFNGVFGRVEFVSGRNFETALRDLDGFERIWLLFAFDRNAGGWRPTTRPPVAAPGVGRVGTFASRSPYRPNPIGLSCVRLLSVRGRTVDVAEADLLDGTPVLDVKPYVPSADSFPSARAGWVDAQPHDEWNVVETADFAVRAEFVRGSGGPDLSSTARVQLSRDPLDASRKRVAMAEDGTWTMSFRMFRISFAADETARTVTLLSIRSGYSAAELASAADPYEDKRLHRALASAFGLE